MIALILTQTIPNSFRLFEQQEIWKVLLLAIGFLAYVLLLFRAAKAADFRMKLAFFAIGPTVLMFFGHFALPNQFRDSKAPGEFLRHNRYRVLPDTVLVSDKYLVSAVCWCYDRSDVFLLGGSGELEYGLGYDDSKQRLLDIDRFKELVTKSPDKRYIILITSTRLYAEYEQNLPKPVFKDVDRGFVFAEFDSSASTGGVSFPAQKAQNYGAGQD